MYKNWPAAILSAVELPKIKFPVLCIEQHQGTYLAAHHHDETYKTQLGYDSIMAPTYWIVNIPRYQGRSVQWPASGVSPKSQDIYILECGIWYRIHESL